VAFAKDQDPPIVKSAPFGPAYGTTYTNIFANSQDESLNISGAVEPVSLVIATLPGLGYTTPPTITFVGGGGSGATATAMLNPFGAIALINAGSGCTTPPTVLLGAPDDPTSANRFQATATATISGGVVTAVSIIEPGAGYITNATPSVGFSGGCTTLPTAQGSITLGSVGHISVTAGGSGYTSSPQVLFSGGGGSGAAATAMLSGALAMTGKGLTEGFDMDYGRMNVLLGSTPSVLTPLVGTGPVLGVSFYIDPPTEILNAGETILWRITHLGADSHAMHFHLFNLQVVNRVDYTNTVKPPYPDELGWREVIRTNPFEDLIVAIKPVSMALPFKLPRSSRLLDPTTVLGSTANFLPVAPPVGVPAVSQTTNVITDFGWEYVWHCHLLGHEENDMMRPIAFQPPTVAPTATPVLAVPTVSAQYNAVTLTWTDADSVTNGLVAGYNIERCTGAACTPTTPSLAYTNRLTYIDTTVVPGTTYTYRIAAVNDAGSSGFSTVQNAVMPAATIPTVAPTPTSPTGNGIATNAPFVFSAVPLASGYTISLTDTTTAVVTPVNFTSAQAGCDSGIGNCSFVMTTPLVVDNRYTWTVAATNTAGTGPASTALAFQVAPSPWTQITGAIISRPALAWNPVNSKIQMVAQGSGNSIWTATFNSDGTFNGDWIQVSGAILSPPAIAWNPSNSKMQMLVQGSGNSIWTSSFNSSGVFNNDWTLIPGTIMSTPAIGWNPTASKIQMVVQGSGNSIWSATFNSSGVFNNDWTLIPGAISSSPAIALNSVTGATQMVVQGGNNSIWSATLNSSGVFNNDWTLIPGISISSPSITWDTVSNTAQMLVRSTGDSIWTSSFNSSGVFNNDWTLIPGATIDTPAIVWNPVKGNFLIVVRGGNNSIWTSEY
jgi:hypothetical protein